MTWKSYYPMNWESYNPRNWVLGNPTTGYANSANREPSNQPSCIFVLTEFIPAKLSDIKSTTVDRVFQRESYSSKKGVILEHGTIYYIEGIMGTDKEFDIEPFQYSGNGLLGNLISIHRKNPVTIKDIQIYLEKNSDLKFYKLIIYGFKI
jgi:hypothetical protein